jgi:hypothetical protein
MSAALPKVVGTGRALRVVTARIVTTVAAVATARARTEKA